jgi:hypothetical protein
MAWSLLPAQVFKIFWTIKVSNKRREPMLWTILVILLVLWLLGFVGHIGGGLIHLLLVIALIVFIVNMVSGRRTV